jgi:two-component system, NarL family, sensor histidine kinase DegS
VASSQAETAQGSLADVAARAAAQVATLDRELAEIDMLVAQARVEAERHELKRAQAVEKIAELPEATPSTDVVAAHAQLVTLTRRASVMESQVEVLEGKRKALGRFREAIAELATDLGVAVESGAELDDAVGVAVAGGGGGGAADMSSTGVTRIVMSAQEDLRRDIARAMHDGPAQSLTNIVLQAQIVDRLVARDPAMAQGEVRQLVAMVQQTLDATKSFIFDVRPMVLDDLGLVPTLRRSARERGQRAGVAVEFESMGTDRRLPMELESGLFRIFDEALTAYLGSAPDRVALRLDWTPERLEGHVSASRDRTSAIEQADRELAEVEAQMKPEEKGRFRRGEKERELPPAMAEMLEERRAAAEAATETARSSAIVALPAASWREIQQRAATVGVSAELVGDGGELAISVDLPTPDAEAAPDADGQS